MSIMIHHQHAIDNLVRTYEKDDRFLALIIGGSVAKGCARPDSDVDFMMVASDEEYLRRKDEQNFFINRTDLTDYPGGYVDGKIIDMHYLREVSMKGNEPSRAAFDGAFLAFNRVEGLDELIEKIRTYPVVGVEERIRSFYCMAFIQNWLMNEADRHDNFYTKARAASQLTLFAGRLILAHNRILYPYHKWLIHYLEKCQHKPKGFIDNLKQVIKSPTATNSQILFDSIRDFHDWRISDIEAYTWFLENVELSWTHGNTPLEDL